MAWGEHSRPASFPVSPTLPFLPAFVSIHVSSTDAQSGEEGRRQGPSPCKVGKGVRNTPICRCRNPHRVSCGANATSSSLCDSRGTHGDGQVAKKTATQRTPFTFSARFRPWRSSFRSPCIRSSSACNAVSLRHAQRAPRPRMAPPNTMRAAIQCLDVTPLLGRAVHLAPVLPVACPPRPWDAA